MRNSACATAFDRLRNSQDCATLQLHFLQTIPAPIELENDTCRPQEQDVIKIPTPMELQTDLECPGKDDTKAPTARELQTDLESPQG